MYIRQSRIFPYRMPSGKMRQGCYLDIYAENGCIGRGEIAPLHGWSKETLQECVEAIGALNILSIQWDVSNIPQQVAGLNLPPAAEFGLETALLSCTTSIVTQDIQEAALCMGSCEEILSQAKKRKQEGYRVAKVKIGSLSSLDAHFVVQNLLPSFSLRLDINRAWTTERALSFLSSYATDTFEYIEEPCRNPLALNRFHHPIAVDESFPSVLSLQQLEAIPSLKALIYKPTLQGGMYRCSLLKKWAEPRGVSIVLSSAFESVVGLSSIAAMAKRLQLCSPIGIGTKHFL